MYRTKPAWATSRNTPTHKPNGTNGTTNYHQVPTIVIQSPETSITAHQLPFADDDDVEEETEEEQLREPLVDKSKQVQVQQPPKPQQQQPIKRIRRNSISFPSELNQLELEALREKYVETDDKISETGFSNNASEAEDDTDVESNRDHCRIPLRNARKKSINNQDMLKPNDDDFLDTPGSTSPGNSITSINSLASLLKEKMQAFPAAFKKKKPNKEYKVKAFVSVLFIVIVSLVGLAYVLYHQQVLQRAYFEKIKFSGGERLMRIFNTDGIEIIHGRLGTTINYDTVFPCLEEDVVNDGSICLEWMRRARLYLNFKQLQEDIRCYNIHWMSLSPEIAPTDCFDLSNDGSHWYGGGQTADSQWPFEKGQHNLSPFITGKISEHNWGNILKRYFINSKGAAIIVDNQVPLYTALKQTEHGKSFCLQAKYDSFAFVNHVTPLPHLNYSICTSSNITKLHYVMSEKNLWDGLKEADIHIINSLLSEPVWEINPISKNDLTDEAVLNYTEEVSAVGFLKLGHVLINEFWQDQIGDFTLDQERFPMLKDIVNVLHRRGFRVVLSIQPFISTESVNFAECVRSGLLISERYSDKGIPALTKYKSLLSAGVLDITNNKTLPWLLKHLRKIQETTEIDAFYLDFGVAFDMPLYYNSDKHIINPDMYKASFINSLQGELSIFGVSSAVERPRPPIFVSLPQFRSTWEDLQIVIPTILTYGIIGYPFLIPGAVGGDIYVEDSTYDYTNKTIENDLSLPDKELYIRWLQLATFLPVIRFTHLPSKYSEGTVLEMAKILTEIRTTRVIPLLKKYTSDSLDSGLPLIRPLWMLDPTDPSCRVVADEFAVGGELIAAPILYPGKREREVYLPVGVWMDGIDGSLRKGSRWIHDYRVPENKVAFFVKMPDDTRL